MDKQQRDAMIADVSKAIMRLKEIRYALMMEREECRVRHNRGVE